MHHGPGPACNHLDGFLSRAVGGETAEGFSYDYEAQGIRMSAESCVVKHGKVFYYLHIYTREEYKDENLKLWSELLSTAKWS